MSNPTDNFYLKQSEPNKSCFLALRQIILDFDPNMNETIKYGLPCFLYHKSIFCYIWKDKKTDKPYLLFNNGTLLNHLALESGDRKKMKSYSVDPYSDIPIQELHDILSEGLNLYRNGIIKIKK